MKKKYISLTIGKTFLVFLASAFLSFNCHESSALGNGSDYLPPALQKNNLTVNGLNNNEVITVKNSSGELIDISRNGETYFSDTLIPAGEVNLPELASSPPGKNCTLNLEIHPENLNSPDGNWVIDCRDIPYYTLSLNISGLNGKNLGLSLNGSAPYLVSKNGKFTFPMSLPDGTDYSIEITRQPDGPEELCRIQSASGTLTANTDEPSVYCAKDVEFLKGTITGTITSPLVLKSSTGEILNVPQGSYDFAFLNFFVENSAYSVSIESQPANEICYLKNQIGIVKPLMKKLEAVCRPRAILNISLTLSGDTKSLSEGEPLVFWFYAEKHQIAIPEFTRSLIYRGEDSIAMDVPEGNYYIRAFSDLDHNNLPQIGPDLQSRDEYTGQVRSGENNQITLNLEDTSSDSRFSSFNAYMMNTQQWIQPSGDHCGGRYLHLEASGFKGQPADISSLLVILPDNSLVELLDDGGCGDSFSNSSSSFDLKKNDMIFTAGINDEFKIFPGKYTFYFKNYITGKISVFTDTLKNTSTLSSLIYLIQPDGKKPVPDSSQILEWNPVEGAQSYEVLIESTDHSLNNFNDPLRFVPFTFYKPSFDLADSKSYRVSIQAFDSDISQETDFDMVSQGPDNFFITDFTGSHSVTISGKLTNFSGAPGGYIIYADSNIDQNSWESSAFLGPESTGYTLAIFKNKSVSGTLLASINFDNSGYILSEKNQPYTLWRSFLSNGNDLTVDLNWAKPLILDGPEDFARGLGTYPLLSWQNYNSPDVKSYILRLEPRTGSASPLIIATKNPCFDFRYINENNYLNLTGLYTCDKNSLKESGTICRVNPNDMIENGIDENSQWQWKVMAVSCDMNWLSEDMTGKEKEIEDYSRCAIDSFHNGNEIIAESAPRVFSAY